MEKPRLKGHVLTRLGALLAQCECGAEFRLEEVESMNRSSRNCMDILMDRHSNHINLRRYKRQQELRRIGQSDGE